MMALNGFTLRGIAFPVSPANLTGFTNRSLAWVTIATRPSVNFLRFVLHAVRNLSFVLHRVRTLDFSQGATVQYLPHVGDAGTKIVVQIVDEQGAPIDVSGASSISIKLALAGQVTREYNAILNTSGTDGRINITTTSLTWDQSGPWQVQGHAIIGGNSFSSERGYFNVDSNL